MLYNNDLKKINKPTNCMTCQWFDKENKRCKGLGKTCFEFDEKTQTCIDPITKMPIILKGEE